MKLTRSPNGLWNIFRLWAENDLDDKLYTKAAKGVELTIEFNKLKELKCLRTCFFW